MRHPGDALGRGCLLVSLTALWAMLAMRLYVVWRDGMWLAWPMGDVLPDALVRRIFTWPDGGPRDALVWLLRQDALYWVAAVCFVLWLIAAPGRSAPGGDDDELSR